MCFGCNLFPTKDVGRLEVFVRFAREIEILWLQNKSGYGQDLANLTYAEEIGLLAWQDELENSQNQETTYTQKLLEMFLNIKRQF